MAENHVYVDNLGPGTTTPSGTAALVTSAPYVPLAANILFGTNTTSDSTTAVTFLTIPANRTFVGQVTVVANSRATTAAYGRATVVVTGVGATPADTSVILSAGSSRDAGACPVTQNIVVIAAAAGAVLQLKNSTATTFDSSACANGVLI